jgi:hypothetical protein
MSKSYIGDGVYAELDDWSAVVLTTENGIETTNRIVLEPREWNELQRWFGQAVDESHRRRREATDAE